MSKLLCKRGSKVKCVVSQFNTHSNYPIIVKRCGFKSNTDVTQTGESEIFFLRQLEASGECIDTAGHTITDYYYSMCFPWQKKRWGGSTRT